MELISQYLEVTTFIITILGLPAAIFIYLREQGMQREEREYGTYDALDNKYIEIQQLCLQYPRLDIFDTPFDQANTLTKEEGKQEESILLIRISIFERAYLRYQLATTKSQQDQWQGWEAEINEWFDRKNFRDVWQCHSPYFDKEFASYFNGYLATLALSSSN